MNIQFDPTWFIWLLPLIIWDGVWKAIGLWKSAKNNQLAWFISMIIFNTAGILPIIYIYFFQKNKK
ncbi:hypothetical protein A2483_04800 [Candidatus Peregrinibacteria bacterium RIFOXYC2_FULL_33_13]|nr:MAG: hypothetical protein UR27_C0007G0096 [Candidatus Peregrinibacteria bacterium GW2011_GWA2_33_10]KKP40843.1 MAG: hypothetical protein UR30_C0003G0015 [Candidatus Peregrinibacteria bacterium GW2011_GWC2_33_13]OGJ50643.1 MAG: hypothetical protein A2229_04610 [Candidatus Peregrinibacteria bacterium RIFOXYA2_FULL_33_7]OGJ55673.1 MAG: hypothetical protein A2483_04800 [Candidatus Peregrinibacteria bacterium RIFOXYC2_FULL_33_13]